jgi:membrane-associated protein
MAAAFCGDNTNYWAGRILGPRVFKFEDSLFFRRAHLVRTEQYYNEYGSRTVIIARFVPIVRTFAPFVAGIGKMPYARFVLFSSIGSVLWVAICVGAGVFFGEMEFVKKHFEFVVLAVIAISLLPIVFEALKKKSRQSSMT